MAAPAPAAAPAQGPIDPKDLEGWTTRFNEALAKPSETLNAKSAEGSQSWSQSLFGCFNPLDLCLVTCFVPCVTFGKTHHRVHKDGNLAGYEPVNTTCLLLCGSACVGLSCIPLAMQRAEVRKKYHLEGDCITDVLLSCCCGCCSVIQQEKEAAHREPLLAQGHKEQYQPATGMAMPPQ